VFLLALVEAAVMVLVLFLTPVAAAVALAVPPWPTFGAATLRWRTGLRMGGARVPGEPEGVRQVQGVGDLSKQQ
jgi:hypothetical protein